MELIDRLVESRIAEAQERGDFDGLPGTGKRQTLDDDRFVPPELRAAYRILKNAGYVPPELERRRQIADVQTLLRSVSADDPAYRRGVRRLNCLQADVESRGTKLRIDTAYAPGVYTKLAGAKP